MNVTTHKPASWRAAGAGQLTLVLAALLVLNALFVSWTEAKKQPGVDFLVYWSVTQAVSGGEVADIYSADGGAEITEGIAKRAANPYLPERQRQASELVLGYERNSVDVVATPFLFSVLSLWEHGDYDSDLGLFTLTCLLLFAAAVLLLARAFGFSPVVGAVLLTLFCIGFGAHAADLRVANVNQLQLFSMAVLVWILRRPGGYRDVGAGVVLGLSIMFRPSVALVAVLLAAGWLVSRDTGRAVRALAGTAAGAAVAVGISALHFGTLACWGSWLQQAPGLIASKGERGKGGLDYGNYGLVALLRDVASVDVSYVVLLMLVAAFGWAVWHGRGRPAVLLDGADDPGFFPAAAAVCLGLVFVLLSSTLVWFHYLLLGIPAVLLGLAVTFGRNAATVPAGWQAASLGSLVFLLNVPLWAVGLPLTVVVALLNLSLLAAAAVLVWALAYRPSIERTDGGIGIAGSQSGAGRGVP